MHRERVFLAKTALPTVNVTDNIRTQEDTLMKREGDAGEQSIHPLRVTADLATDPANLRFGPEGAN